MEAYVIYNSELDKYLAVDESDLLTIPDGFEYQWLDEITEDPLLDLRTIIIYRSQHIPTFEEIIDFILSEYGNCEEIDLSVCMLIRMDVDNEEHYGLKNYHIIYEDAMSLGGLAEFTV